MDTLTCLVSPDLWAVRQACYLLCSVSATGCILVDLYSLHKPMQTYLTVFMSVHMVHYVV